MSTTDDDRLGLGWEVWFLIAGLVAGAVTAVQIVGLIGIGFDAVSQPVSHRASVEVDLGRLLAGGSAAFVLAATAIRLIVVTDWRLDPPTDTATDDRSS